MLERGVEEVLATCTLTCLRLIAEIQFSCSSRQAVFNNILHMAII